MRRRYVFVTGMGRSGTTWLAGLLQEADGCVCRHEFIGDRQYWLLSWYLGASWAVPCLERAKAEIDRRFPEGVFVDVNGYLHHSVPFLKEVFGDVAVFHLVRDPRNVVPSIHARRNPEDMQILPKDEGDIRHWIDRGKFWQICWNWADTTKRLVAQGIPVLQFERLVSDYEYLRTRLLEPAGIHVAEDFWEEARRNRCNRTRSRLYRYVYAKLRGRQPVTNTLPPYEEWSAERKQAFRDLCGEAMQLVGYDLP